MPRDAVDPVNNSPVLNPSSSRVLVRLLLTSISLLSPHKKSHKSKTIKETQTNYFDDDDDEDICDTRDGKDGDDDNDL